MKDLRRSTKDRWLDHGALADWSVAHVGGTRMAAAYYYTGVPSSADDGAERRALADLLEQLEKRPGFFVKRFNRRNTTRDCPHCKQMISYTEEKMVDTSLVADMITLAVANAFDAAVVFSGDLDLAPALNALHALGKPAWVATFGNEGLSRSLTRQAWSAINLVEHIDEFAYPELGSDTEPRTEPIDPQALDQEMLRELRRAEAHFTAGGGFVGAHYFIHRWKGHNIPENPEDRRQALQRLMGLGSVETYTVDGKTAVRSLSGAVVPTPIEDTGRIEEEETVEMRLSDAMKKLRAKLRE